MQISTFCTKFTFLIPFQEITNSCVHWFTAFIVFTLTCGFPFLTQTWMMIWAIVIQASSQFSIFTDFEMVANLTFITKLTTAELDPPPTITWFRWYIVSWMKVLTIPTCLYFKLTLFTHLVTLAYFSMILFTVKYVMTNSLFLSICAYR